MGVENLVACHTGNGIKIDNFFYSGEVLGEYKGKQSVLNYNHYLQKLDLRVGPVFDDSGRIVGLGRFDFSEEEISGGRLSLREALERLSSLE